MKTAKAVIKTLVLIVLVLGFAGVIYLYSGAYNIGADVPHNAVTHWFLATLRDRSVATHAQGVAVPNLNDPKRVASGAHQYAGRCSGCHLAPGMSDTEIRQGLYPRPPRLSHGPALPPATVYWVVKHGIKFTAMPAWGPTHDDADLWAIVAFVEKLPTLSAEQYAALTTRGHASAELAAGGAAPPHPAAAASTPAPASTRAAPPPAATQALPPPASQAPAAASSGAPTPAASTDTD